MMYGLMYGFGFFLCIVPVDGIHQGVIMAASKKSCSGERFECWQIAAYTCTAGAQMYDAAQVPRLQHTEQLIQPCMTLLHCG